MSQNKSKKSEVLFPATQSNPGGDGRTEPVQATGPGAKDQTQNAPHRQPRRVLVADDEHLLAQSLCGDLQAMGYAVIGPASSGDLAINLARQDRPDIALLDVRMPNLDGLAAAEIMFTQLNIPVVILSAYGDMAYVQTAARHGVFGYLLKPSSSEELHAALCIAWQRFHDQRRLAEKANDLRLQLAQRKTIERAKGLLMQHLKLTEDQSIRRLQKQARDSRRRLVEVAQAVIDTQGLLNNDTSGGST